MKRQVKKTDALKFLKNKGIDESLNNIAGLMEEFAEFKIQEYKKVHNIIARNVNELLDANIKLTEECYNLRKEVKETIKDNLSCHVVEGFCGMDNYKSVNTMLDELGKTLNYKFGTESYLERCKISDIKEMIINNNESSGTCECEQETCKMIKGKCKNLAYR
jgi:uncharacterized surface protein with fasciclin (FAS1) repeats